MFDITNKASLKETRLINSNGNTDEIIGISAKEPDWKSIVDIGFGSKYKGVTQSISNVFTPTILKIPPLEVSKDVPVKKSLEYVIPKELITILVHSSLPYSLTANMEFSKDFSNLLFKANSLGGLLWKCFSWKLSEESSIEFIRKQFERYISEIDKVSKTFCSSHTQYVYKYDDEDVQVESIKIERCDGITKTFSKFFKELNKIGTWSISKPVLSEGDYGFVNYTDLRPSDNYKSLRKNTAAYKNYLKEHGNKNTDFEYRQEAALDVIKGLAATPYTKNTHKLWLTRNGGTIYDKTFQGDVGGYEVANHDGIVVYVSPTIPLVKSPLCIAKNEFGRIWNYSDFLKNDIRIFFDYTHTKTVNGNLFKNANVPDGIGSTEVLLKESLGPHTFGNRTKCSPFIRDDNFLNDLIKNENKRFTFGSLLSTLETLVGKYPKQPYPSIILKEFKAIIPKGYESAYISTVSSEVPGTWYQHSNSRCFAFRFMIMEYFASYLDSIVDESFMMPSRNYPLNGALYEPSKHPLLKQYLEVPPLKWISNDAVKYASEILKNRIIPAILSKIVSDITYNGTDNARLQKVSDIKKEYLLKKYQKEINGKILTSMLETPIFPIVGNFNDGTFSTTFKGVNQYDFFDENYLDNSLYWFNQNLLENWKLWSRYQHLQIHLPTAYESLETFEYNMKTLRISFPSTYDEIDKNAIQFVSKDVNFGEKSECLRICEDGSFLMVDILTVPYLDIVKGSLEKKNVYVYIPSSMNHQVKYIIKDIETRRKTGSKTLTTGAIVVGYSLEEVSQIPLHFRNC